MMKKVISIIAIVAGGLVLLGVVAPEIIGIMLLPYAASGSMSIIGGADGPTAMFLIGRVGSVSIWAAIGILLIVAGIWGLRRLKK